MIPKDILEAAKNFLEEIDERNEANEEEEYDSAFEIECSQRDHGAIIADWITKKVKCQDHDVSKCPYCDGTDLSSSGNPEHGVDSLWQKIECENCGESWNDVYEFAFWEPES